MHNNEWLAQNKYLGASKYYYYYCCILLVSSLLLLLLIIIYFPKISLYFSYVQRKWPRDKWGVREVRSLSAEKVYTIQTEWQVVRTDICASFSNEENTLICSSSSASLGSQETSTFGWSCSPSERVTTCPRLYIQWNWEILALNPKCDTLLTPEFMYFRWTRASELEGGDQEQRSPLPSVNCCGRWCVTVTLRPTQPVAETNCSRQAQSGTEGRGHQTHLAVDSTSAFAYWWLCY